MKAHAEWILKTAWLVSPLTLWLKVPNLWRVRVLLPAVFLCCLSSVGYLLFSAHTRPSVPEAIAQTVTKVSNPVTVLPALSGVALLELTQHLHNAEVNQRDGQFNLTFTTNWQSFAEFSHQIMQSNLAPLSYRMHWPPVHASTQEPAGKAFNVQLQLAPGVYQAPESGDIRWLPPAIVENKDAPVSQPQCPTQPIPDFVLQASWPSRGYVQVLINGRSERIEINQLLGNSWQLRRIGSDSLGFSWHNADPACHNEKTMTVAI